ncbi:MAG: DUF3747 domain-containing protein [Thermosynechococcaceae cyanobacterium]
MRLSTRWIAIAAWAASNLPLLISTPTVAATFGQTEVNQSKFIAIAVPRASGYFTLLVLEQISSQKPCWRESGSKPTRVEPLLLNFNFSGICGRSTDSNGYSIRIAGKDMGLVYRLSLQKKQDNVVLVGVPGSSGQGKPITLGSTQGIRSGFLKITLNSGWRFAKRTYNGKSLGHVYFSRDSSAPVYQATKSSPVKSAAAPVKATKSSDQSKTPDRPQIYRVMVLDPDGLEQTKLRAQHPSAFRTTYSGKTAMQIGLFSDRAKAQSLQDSLKRQGFRVVMATDERRALNTSPLIVAVTNLSSVQPSLIAVPNNKAPLGHGGNLAAVLPPPPPPPQALLAPRYRVVVVTPSKRDQNQIRTLVPDAFRTNYQGQTAMQVGSFPNRTAAETVMTLVQRHGFKPITVQM